MPTRYLVQCKDLSAYEELTDSPDTLIPVLGQRDSDAELAHALNADLLPLGTAVPDPTPTAARTPPAQGGDADCILARDDAYLPFAKALARWTGRQLIVDASGFDRVDSLPHRSVLAVATPDAFSFGVLARFASTSSAAPQGLGILSGRSAGALSRRVARVAFTPPGSRRKSTQAGTEGAHLDWSPDGTLLAPPSRSDPSRLHGQLDMVLATSHGSSIDMDLGVAVLCGRSDPNAVCVYPCVFGQGCKRDRDGSGTLVTIDSIDARVMFIESCNAIGMGSALYPDGALLSLGSMDGPAAFIGTYKIVRSSHGLLACLAGALLESGYRFGEVAAMVNRVQASAVGDVPSFVLMGDPCARLPQRGEPRRMEVPEEVDSLPLTFRIDCPDFEGRVLDAVVPVSAEVAEGWQPSRIRIAIEPPRRDDETIFAVVLPAGPRQARVLVCMDQARELRHVRVSTERDHPRSALPVLLRTAWSGIETLEALREGLALAMGKAPIATTSVDDLDAIVKPARQFTQGLEYLEQTRRTHVTALHGWDRPVQEMLDAYAQLSAKLVTDFRSWGLSAHIAWGYNYLLKPVGLEHLCDPCDACGSPTYQIEHSCFRTSAMARTILHCARCGILADHPAGHRRVRVAGPAVVTAGTTARFEWTVPNDLPFAVRASATAIFPHTPDDFACHFVPEVCQVDIPANGEAVVSMNLEVGADVQPGHYDMAVLVSSVLAMHVAGRTFVARAATPATGRH